MFIQLGSDVDVPGVDRTEHQLGHALALFVY